MLLQKPMLGTQIDWSNPLNDGLVLDLLFNEGHGNIVYDLSGYGNHGTLNGFDFPPTQASGWNPGLDGVALSFNGTDDYVDCGNDASLYSANLSIEAWIYRNASNVRDAIIYKTSAGAGIHFGITGDTNVLQLNLIESATNHIVTSTPSTVPSGKWVHVAVSCDGSNVRFYISGVMVAEVAQPIPVPDYSAGDLLIGYVGPSNSWNLNGTIDEVRIYNRALSADEIMQRYINPYGVYLQ